ncbi:MAG: TonB-dependent receptor [Pseudomonadota bacterium]
MQSPHPIARALGLACLCAATVTAPRAQTDPAPRPAEPAASAPAPASQRIDVTANRPSDSEQRRQATAAKIVIGRDEIERYGDSSTSEVLKRLPGITMPGPGGRGGGPRMRGMAGAYTQILLDGERVPPGFSLDSIAPEQIERIEILRAPTAETGARAIAGSINIVLREGFRKRMNDLRVGTGVENGSASPSLNWTRNDSLADWIYNLSLSTFRRVQDNQSHSLLQREDITDDTTTLLRESHFSSRDTRSGVHATGRLQWRDEQGRSAVLQPLLIHSEGDTASRGSVRDLIADPNDPLEFVRSRTRSDGRFTLLRLNGQFNHRLGTDTRLEWRFGLGDGHWRNTSLREEFDSADEVSRTIDDRTDNRDRNATLSLKASNTLEGGHSLVGGVELERNRRIEARTTLWDGVPQLTEFGDNLQASSRRYAVYAQDEWSITPQWAAHAGLRIEGITTEGEGANDSVQRNASRVATPLLHAVWRPDPKSRDQVRASLTRSYRSPNLNQLIGRPSLSRSDPPPGGNTELTADSAGNPRLRPEIAIGIDVAVERYLAEGGVLSANLFHRRISDLIRNVVALEDVSWSPGVPRFVSRPQNIGNASSQGIELEAKFRLSDVLDSAPRVDVRANMSLFRSRVEGIPGPDNRLAEQPGGTLNLGADYRLRGLPLTLGGNVNHTPGYDIRLDTDRWAVQPDKTVIDAYALWVFNPDLQLRLSVGNALAQDHVTHTRVESAAVRESVASTARSYVNWQLRLEMKL